MLNIWEKTWKDEDPHKSLARQDGDQEFPLGGTRSGDSDLNLAESTPPSGDDLLGAVLPSGHSSSKRSRKYFPEGLSANEEAAASQPFKKQKRGNSDSLGSHLPEVSEAHSPSSSLQNKMDALEAQVYEHAKRENSDFHPRLRHYRN